MEGSEFWISFRRIWISIPPGFDFVPTGFDFLPTDFEFLQRVLEVGTSAAWGCGVEIFASKKLGKSFLPAKRRPVHNRDAPPSWATAKRPGHAPQVSFRHACASASWLNTSGGQF